MHTRQVEIVLPTLSQGGAEKVMVSLANYYASSGIEVLMIGRDLSGEYRARLDQRISVMELSASGYLLFFIKYILHSAKRPKRKVITTIRECSLMVLLANLLVGNISSVTVREANAIKAQLEGKPKIISFILSGLMGWLYPKAAQLIVLSNWLKQEVLEKIDISPEKVHVISNPVSLSDVKGVANSFIFSSTQFWLLSVGRLTHHKRHVDSISAIYKLRNKGYDVGLIILGAGPESRALQEEVSRLGLDAYIDLKGGVGNVNDYYKKCHLYLLASEFEGMSNSLLEAIAYGLPVLASDSPGANKEIVDRYKVGDLFSTGNVDQIVEKVACKVSSKPSRLPGELSSKVLSDFSTQRQLIRYKELVL